MDETIKQIIGELPYTLVLSETDYGKLTRVEIIVEASVETVTKAVLDNKSISAVHISVLNGHSSSVSITFNQTTL